MGGRIALRSSNPKILLSTHPGLQTPEEKAQRIKHDRKWIQMFEQGSLEEFLKTWYAQPLFDSLRAIQSFLKSFLEDSSKILKCWSRC